MTEARKVGGGPYRVLIADDSSAMRALVQRALQAAPTVEVLGAVADAHEALARTQRAAAEGRPVEVLLLDIEMPVMDGLAALPALVATAPPPRVIMVSSLTQRGAAATMRALLLGASDYVCKPSAREPGSVDAFCQDLRRRIGVWGALARQAAGGKAASGPGIDADNHAPAACAGHKARPSGLATIIPGAPAADAARVGMASRPAPAPGWRPAAIAIGGSTGAPQVLLRLMADLAGCHLGPLFITQHMPPGFTRILAEQLGRAGRRPCGEAVDGGPVREGEAYVAPGDFHLEVAREGPRLTLRVGQGMPENHCRPAVDPMFRSLAAAYGGRLLAVVLTGTGQDGLKGAAAVVAAGGTVIVQDQASSAAWGMPGAVARRGLATAELPVAELGPALRRLAAGRAG
jgi:two-component system chemotaxis response regulator CheB